MIGHRVRNANVDVADGSATLHKTHCFNESAHLILVSDGDNLATANLGPSANNRDISLSVILRNRSPPGHDSRNSAQLISLDVGPQENKPRPETVADGCELTKSLISLFTS